MCTAARGHSGQSSRHYLPHGDAETETCITGPGSIALHQVTP
jgi:hypothetical protein